MGPILVRWWGHMFWIPWLINVRIRLMMVYRVSRAGHYGGVSINLLCVEALPGIWHHSGKHCKTTWESVICQNSLAFQFNPGLQHSHLGLKLGSWTQSYYTLVRPRGWHMSPNLFSPAVCCSLFPLNVFRLNEKATNAHLSSGPCLTKTVTKWEYVIAGGSET